MVRWTHLETFGGTASLEEQMRFAERLVRAGGMEEQARRVYLGVLERAAGLDASELHDATGGKAAPGKVSFDLKDTDANAHAGITGKLPSDRDTELPEPTLVVGPGSFTSFPALRATVLHEFTHLNHAKLAIATVRRWRATATDGAFKSWLNRELKAGRIDAVDHAVIVDKVEGGTKNTEALSYLVSFIASYDLTDVAAMPAGDDVIDGFLFAKLGQLAGEWVKADHVVEEHVLERLLAYRDTLDGVRRARLQRYAARRYEANDAKSDFRLFWGPLR